MQILEACLNLSQTTSGSITPPPKRAKVFGIGLNKTGTTTLHECGKILGYRCTSCSRSLLDDIGCAATSVPPKNLLINTISLKTGLGP
jgi:hypothetical protein